MIETSTVSPTEGDSPAIEAHGRIHKPSHMKADTLVVAVHGVGDQYRKATLQSVVKQFCRACGEPTGIPLGAFHNDHPTYSFDKAQREETRLSSFAFAEVYWAETPQKVVKDQHTLEGAKAWAETLVERVRMRAAGRTEKGKPVCTESDSALATQVLREMIETVAVTERLCYLADKAGLFTFDLRRVLDDYLGDVQVVAEFADKRKEILETFQKTMEAAYRQCGHKAPVVIVAHSEGTVVALLGLLQAFRKPKHQVPEWAMNVRGFMTLGSPIDKHLYFWPELFDGEAPTTVPRERIVWHNYYDYGDPIGFKLDSARKRINESAPPAAAHAWSEVFDFPDDNDHGFSRYIFPGKAHVDYWTDEAVFGHFLEAVFGKRPNFLRKTPPLADLAPRRWAQFVSWFAPYVGIWALLFIGAFVLYRAALAAMLPGGGPGTRAIIQEVFAVSMLLFGVTIAARVPRLTKSLTTRMWAVGFAALCVLVYAAIVGETSNALRLSGWEAGGTYVWMGVGLTIATWFLAVFFPMAGALPMIATGGFLSAALLIFRMSGDIKGSAWPVVLAFGLYLYFWWLSALLFDLVVVWHIYIRSSLVNDRLNDLTSSPHDATRWVMPPDPPQHAS